MKKYIRQSNLTIAALLLFSGSLFANKGFTLSGTIKDAKSGENLIGVTVYISGTSIFGAYTNEYGYYSIQLPVGTNNITVSYLGYTAITEQIVVNQPVIRNWNLESNNKLGEVVVSSTCLDDNLTKPQIGLEKINMAEIAKLPVLFW
ncbi:MAG TPA: carboxypeptidase-like regulatory domain-containing protein [Bacteroidales bacterium]|nr:carboxypeptidase-like regulatory domain-containing protein [Bacteroidales bacterium]